MWKPVKLKADSGTRAPRSPGWYCHDTESSYTDLGKRRSGKQAAQKECDRRNAADAKQETDGKTRNPKRWYTVAYLDRSGALLPGDFQPVHYLGYLSDMLRQIGAVMHQGHVSGASVAAIWRDNLSREAILYDEKTLPIRHVFADGQITATSI